MGKIYLVKTGKTYRLPGFMKTVAAFDTAEDCEEWISQNIQPGQHMYIEPAEKLSQQELHDIINLYKVVPVNIRR